MCDWPLYDAPHLHELLRLRLSSMLLLQAASTLLQCPVLVADSTSEASPDPSFAKRLCKWQPLVPPSNQRTCKPRRNVVQLSQRASSTCDRNVEKLNMPMKSRRWIQVEKKWQLLGKEVLDVEVVGKSSNAFAHFQPPVTRMLLCLQKNLNQTSIRVWIQPWSRSIFLSDAKCRIIPAAKPGTPATVSRKMHLITKSNTNPKQKGL